MHRLATLLTLALLPVAWCIDITGRIVLDTFPNQAIPIGSKVVLDHGFQTSLILHDGSFTIRGVQDGEYLVQPIIPGYSTPTTLYTIKDSSIHAQPYIPSKLPLPSTSPSIPLPITIIPVKEDYYTPAVGMNILGMLKNPMVLMMLFSGVMMYGMPKLMSMMDMDPEMAKDMAETRKKMQGMQNMDFMGSLSSMLAGEAPAENKAVTNAGATASNGAGAAAAAKKRKGR